MVKLLCNYDDLSMDLSAAICFLQGRAHLGIKLAQTRAQQEMQRAGLPVTLVEFLPPDISKALALCFFSIHASQ